MVPGRTASSLSTRRGRATTPRASEGRPAQGSAGTSACVSGRTIISPTTLAADGPSGQGRVPPSPKGGCHEGAPGRRTPSARLFAALLRAREVEERRLHAAADVLGVRQPELREDRVDVLLDR